jgi:hypothetical protein
MRKICLLLSVVLLVAVGAYAQGGTRTYSTFSFKTENAVKDSAGRVRITKVSISLPGGLLTADEGVLDEAAKTFELVGNVKLQLKPPAK